MNKFEDLCAELDNLDIVYKTSSNNGTDGEYAMLVGDGKYGSACYMAIAYSEGIDTFSYYLVNGRCHSIKITKSEEEVLTRVARFYFEVYEENTPPLDKLKNL